MTLTGSMDDQHEERNAKLEAVARELSERNAALADARARLQELETEVAARRRKAGNEGDMSGSAWYLALEELYDRVDWISPPMYLSPSCSPPFPPPDGIPRLAGTTARFRLAPHVARAASQAALNAERSHPTAGHAAGHERLVEIWSARSQASTADEAAGCPQEVQLPKTSEDAQVEVLCSQLALQAAAIASSHVEGICRSARCEAATPELRAEAAELRAEVHHARGGEEAAGAAQAAASAALATVNALLAANSAAFRAQQDATSGAPLAHTMESMQSCLSELQAGAEGLTKAVAATSSQLKQQLNSVTALANGDAAQSAVAVNAPDTPSAAVEECHRSSLALCPEAAALAPACSTMTPATVKDTHATASAAEADNPTASVAVTLSEEGVVASGKQQDLKNVAESGDLLRPLDGSQRRCQFALPRTSELAAVVSGREAGARGSTSPACRSASVTSSPAVSRISSAPVPAPKPPPALERMSSMVTSPFRRVVRAEEGSTLQCRQSPSPNARLLQTPASASCSPSPAARMQSSFRTSGLRQRPPSQAVLLTPPTVASCGSCCNLTASLRTAPANAVPVGSRRMQLPCPGGSSGAPAMPASLIPVAASSAVMSAPTTSTDAAAAVRHLSRTVTPTRANSPVRMRSAQVVSPLRRTAATAPAATPAVSSSVTATSAGSSTPVLPSHQQVSAVRRFGGEALQSIASVLADQSPSSQSQRATHRSLSKDESEKVSKFSVDALPTFGVDAQDTQGKVFPPKSPQTWTVAESLQNSERVKCVEQGKRAEHVEHVERKESTNYAKCEELVKRVERSPSPVRRPPWPLQSPQCQVSSSGLAILPPPRPAGVAATGSSGTRVHASPLLSFTTCRSASPLAAHRLPVSSPSSPARR